MKVKTMRGRKIDLKQETIDGLKPRLRGPVITPDDGGYEESRTIWNSMIGKKPAFIVRCLGNADVIDCVQFERDRDILLSKVEGTISPAW